MSQTTGVTVPSNPELVHKLDCTAKALRQERQHNPQLDQRGKQLASAVESLIETSKDLIENKNVDEKLQKFINHAIAFGEKLKNQQQQLISNKDIHESMEKLSALSENFKNLVKQLVSCAEYRGMFLSLLESIDGIVWSVAEKKSNEGQTGQKNESKIQPQESHISDARSQDQSLSQDTKQILDEIPQEEKNLVAQKVLNILSRMGRTPEYQQATNNILGMFDYFRSEHDLEDLGAELRDEMKQLYQEGASVIQEFAGQKDLAQLKDKFWEMYKVCYEDPETRKYFHELREWVNQALAHPESVDGKEVVDETSRLMNQAYSLRGKYSGLFREIIDEFKDLLNKLQEDEYSRQFQDHLSAFQEAFRYSPFETLSQTRHLMFPVIRELLSEFPLPRIVGRTEDSTYSIDQMVLRGRKMHIEDIVVNLKFGLKDLMQLSFEVKDISAEIKNAQFTYNSDGLIPWSDEGCFDVNIASPRWKFKWIVRERRDQPLKLELVKIDVRLKRFDIVLEEARHIVFDRIMLSLFQTSLQQKAEEELAAVLGKQAVNLSGMINSIFFPNSSSQDSSSSQSKDESTFSGTQREESYYTVSDSMADKPVPAMESETRVPIELFQNY